MHEAVLQFQTASASTEGSFKARLDLFIPLNTENMSIESQSLSTAHRIMDLSFQHTFAPGNKNSIGETFAPWNFCSQELSFPGANVTWMELSFTGTFAPWYFCSLELSFLGSFVPRSKSHVKLSLPGTFVPWNFCPQTRITFIYMIS